MALFGRTREMAGQFMPQIDPETQGAINQYAAMPMQKKGFLGGLFGQGGFGRHVLGSLGDVLSQNAGFDPTYAPRMMLRQKSAMESQQAEAQRSANWEDWQRQYEYERSNPKPTQNDTERDYQFMVQTVGEGPAKEWLRRRGDPLVNMTLPNGQFYSGPQSGLQAALGGGMQAPSSPTIKTIGGKTYQNINGKWYEMGGGATSGTGNFPGQ